MRGVRKVLVNIPAGVDNGINVRVTGEGEVPPGRGKPGNLYVALTVTPHEYFKRQGTDITYETQISAANASTGTETSVPTIYGSVRLKIPRGTKDGQIFRLKGKGVQVVHSARRGDELVTVRVI